MWNFRFRLLRYLNKLKSYLCAFRFGTGVLSVFTQFFLLSYLPLVLPLLQDTFFCIRIMLSLYLNICKSGLSESRPNCLWLPKYSSIPSISFKTAATTVGYLFLSYILFEVSRTFCWLSRAHIFMSYILF